LFFRTVPSANTLVRWVNENAFAFIVQARPCPTFGRPVHLRGGPHRLQPGTSPHALRIPPRDGHPALRELRSGGSRSALVCFRLSPSCPFRPLHTFHSSRPARHYPRFWIRRSSFERRRDLNPPDQRAAQRTLRRCTTPLGKATALAGCRNKRYPPRRRAWWTYRSSLSPPDPLPFGCGWPRGLSVLARGVSMRAWGLGARA
jgi:hypothetical protein